MISLGVALIIVTTIITLIGAVRAVKRSMHVAQRNYYDAGSAPNIHTYWDNDTETTYDEYPPPVDQESTDFERERMTACGSRQKGFSCRGPPRNLDELDSGLSESELYSHMLSPTCRLN